MSVPGLEFINLGVGALLGGVVGYGVNSSQVWLSRPRVKRYGFAKRVPEFEGGYLHKLWFELTGKVAPGLCSLDVTHQAPDGTERGTFAKWDETAQPFDSEGRFWPEMAPASYQHVLHLERIYTVPIAIEFEDKFYLFNSWWYGRSRFPEVLHEISRVGLIKLSLTGQNLNWKRSFPVREVLGGPEFEGFESDSKQSRVRRLVDNI